jgi:hypothetical protein
MLQAIKNFFQKQKQRKIAKNAKLVRNPKAVKEDRMAALHYLKSIDDPDATIPALLARFEYSLEHGIVDAREKDVAYEGIMKHQEKAIPFLNEHLAKTHKMAWPIKILTQLAPADDVKNILLNALNFDDISFDQILVDKNYDVLCYLADFSLGADWSKICPFLNDPDERVRFACVEVLGQQDDPNIKDHVVQFLKDETPENRRIRMSVIQLFLKNQWPIDNPQDYADGPLIEGVFVTKQGLLEKRS